MRFEPTEKWIGGTVWYWSLPVKYVELTDLHRYSMQTKEIFNKLVSKVVSHRYQYTDTDTSMNFHGDTNTGMGINTNTDTSINTNTRRLLPISYRYQMIYW